MSVSHKTVGYAGAKQKIALELYDKIKEVERDYGVHYQTWLEPFCGMLNVGLVALADGRRVYFSDANPDIIQFWKDV